MVVYIIKIMRSHMTRTFVDKPVKMFVFCFVFIYIQTHSSTHQKPNKKEDIGGCRTFVLKMPLSFFARLFSGSAHPRTHVLLKSVSSESNTFTSLNIDISTFPPTPLTQSQHSHMSLLSLDYILFLSYNVCFCILCFRLLMLIYLVIDLLLLAHSLLTFKYTLQL